MILIEKMGICSGLLCFAPGKNSGPSVGCRAAVCVALVQWASRWLPRGVDNGAGAGMKHCISTNGWPGILSGCEAQEVCTKVHIEPNFHLQMAYHFRDANRKISSVIKRIY
jgi:hypothetical protein